MTAPLTIRKLTIRDVLRISVVEITPSGDVVTLGGANASGKSSVLNAIELALAGLRDAPPKPIRRGAERGEVVVDLGDIVVERTFTAAGSDLIVKSRDGARYPKPQAMLDALFAQLAFDPLAFSRMEPGVQAETLRRLVGIDVADLDAERDRLFAQRTDIHRDGKAAKARLDAAPAQPDAPAVEVDPAELAGELEARLRQKREADDLHRRAEEAARASEYARGEVARLEKQLAEARERATACDAKAAALRDEAAAAPVPDIAEVRTRIAAVEAQNAKVRAQRAHERLAGEVDALRTQATALSERLKAIASEREARIAAAAFPVPALGFDDSGVTLDGLPFEQASKAEQMRVSVMIGVAANPKLRVFFVRDGSLLDKEGVRLIADLARENKCQVWVEDTRADSADAIIISDGTVRGAVPEEQGTLPGVGT